MKVPKGHRISNDKKHQQQPELGESTSIPLSGVNCDFFGEMQKKKKKRATGDGEGALSEKCEGLECAGMNSCAEGGQSGSQGRQGDSL